MSENEDAPRAAAKAPVTLRLATEADAEFLCAVYASTRAEELAVTGWTDAQKAAFCRQQFDAQTAHYRAHYTGAEYSIVECGGVPVGRLFLARWEKEIRIMDIALLSEHRGAGIGTTLLRELQAEASASSRTLTIHVEKFNPALRLYQRMGFYPIEDKGVYLLMEWKG